MAPAYLSLSALLCCVASHRPPAVTLFGFNKHASSTLHFRIGEAMRRNLTTVLVGGVACARTCNALIAPDANMFGFRSPTSVHVYSNLPVSQNHDRSSPLTATKSSDEDTSDNPTRRKRTVVRVTTSRRGTATKSSSKEAQTLRKKLNTVTIKAPRMSSLNHRRIGTRKPQDVENTESKKANAPVKIPHNLASGAVYQRNEMIEHELLTKEEEFDLGRSIVKARVLRENIESLIEERKFDEIAHDYKDYEKSASSRGEIDMDFLTYELEYLSMYGFRPGAKQEYDLEDELIIEHAQHRSQHLNQMKNGNDASTPPEYRRSGYRNGSSSSTAANNSYTPLLHIPIHQLSESDIISIGIPGGKVEAIEVLLEGARAREVLMRRNIKLVISIAKNWMRNSYSTENANNPGSSQKKRLSHIYDGSWDRPSLDEAVQEGVLGLARAVDKYDPERGLRFSTYATHWVTSYVRVCFQRAVTGCLRVPSQLHDIKTAYKKIVKNYYQSAEAPPAMKELAKELGITEKRLNTAIRATTPLVSVDAPMVLPGSGNHKGSAAGGDQSNQELMILDTLRW